MTKRIFLLTCIDNFSAWQAADTAAGIGLRVVSIHWAPQYPRDADGAWCVWVECPGDFDRDRLDCAVDHRRAMDSGEPRP